MNPPASKAQIFLVRILADGSCWLADTRRSSNKHGHFPSEEELDSTATRAVMAAVAAALPMTANSLSRSHRGTSREGAMAIFLRTLAESQRRDYCYDLLDSSRVAIHFGAAGQRAPQTRALHAMLRNAGFFPLGVVKVDGRTVWFWSRQPSLFLDQGGNLDTNRIRDFLDDL